MLELYLSSIIVWFIVIMSSFAVCGKAIVKNGWAKAAEKLITFKSLVLVLALAAIPVFRLIVCAATFSMASMSKEEYYKMKNGDE